MDDKTREFIRDMKVLLTKLEYENDKASQMDLVDRIHYATRDFQKDFCD